MYIDSHAHLTGADVFDDIDAILERAQIAGVDAILNICTDIASLEKGLELAKRVPWVYNVASTTPHDVEKEGEAVFITMAQAAKSGQLVAIGETGLDYHYKLSDIEIQKDFFRRYLRLAIECELPVVIHCRDAFEDFFQIVDEEYVVDGTTRKGLLHCFTGTADEAQQLLKRGWSISFSGIVTFKNSSDLRSIVADMPSDRFLIETDTPYLAPQKWRGKRNEPSYLPETARVISALRGISQEEVGRLAAENTRHLFNI